MKQFTAHAAKKFQPDILEISSDDNFCALLLCSSKRGLSEVSFCDYVCVTRRVDVWCAARNFKLKCFLKLSMSSSYVMLC